ncbi:19755_t:CDS:2, partial [Racocetra persica]
MAGRKVILLVDNARCYSSSNLNLHNTTVYYLSPNTTSHIQPLNTSIIISFKHRYKNYFIKWLLNQYESKKDDKLNHTKILLVQSNKEPTNDDNDNELIEEMKVDIEALNFQNTIDLEVYINYLEEEDTNEALNDQKILTLVTNIEPGKDLNEDDNSEEDENN